uniref:Myosin light chain kinase A n=1 Tax=Phallusia mammillata TaxID=59560 RepID=A0A6F9DMC1_9ASCI|nr:myosin light chain kinase A [Phallusia mammillata]
MSDAKSTLNDSASSNESKTSSDKTSKYTSSGTEDVDKQLMPSPGDSTPLGSGESKSTNNTSSVPTSGTVSSGDTVPTQEVQEETDSSQNPENVWGIILALRPEFVHLDLVESKYVFGRDQKCDYCLDLPSIRRTKYFKNYSKKHFIVWRTIKEDGATDQVFVQDLGGLNGTFVNGEKIPSNDKRPIKVRDRIAMSSSGNDVFLFIDKVAGKEEQFHEDFLRKYIVDQMLGRGACGKVHEVWSKLGAGRFAAKVISKAQLSVYSAQPYIQQRDITEEAEILRKLKHPCIIGVHEVIDTPKDLHIILEYAGGGELFERLAEKGPLTESTAKLYFYQMLAAVTYLHNNDITHRDLKPENILMMSTHEEQCLIKITDFGMSRLVEEQSLMMTLAGTPSYLAPEIVKQLQSPINQGYTKLVDLWSLGVILFVCLVAYPPFSKDRPDTKQTINEQIMNANYSFSTVNWKKISKNAKDLITCLLQLDVTKRFSTSQAMEHTWLDDPAMHKKANELMYPNRTMGEKGISDVSVNTRKVSSDNDYQSGQSSRVTSATSEDELIKEGMLLDQDLTDAIKTGTKRHQPSPFENDDSNEPVASKQVKRL